MYNNFDLSNATKTFLSFQKEYVLNRMIMMPVDGFTPQVRRDYRISIHDDSVLTENIVRDLSQNQFNADAVNQLAANVMSYTTRPESGIMVPNGWSERRIVWYMEIQVIEQGRIKNLMVTGYTDKLDVSANMHLAPDTRLHVVSSLEYEMQGMRQVVLDSKNFVLPDQNRRDYMARPYDVMTQLTLEAERDRLHTSTLLSRTDNSIKTTTTSNSRSASASHWLANSMKATKDVLNAVDDPNEPGISPGEYYGMSASRCAEKSVRDDSFFGACSEVANEMINNNGSLSLGVLDRALNAGGQLLDPAHSDRVDWIESASGSGMYGSGFESHNWAELTQEAISATAIRNVATSVVQERMLQQVAFHWDMFNRPAFGSGDFPADLDMYNITIMNAAGWTLALSGNPLRELAIQVVSRIMREMGPTISKSGMMPCTGMVDVDLLGHITIRIQYDGGELKQYVAPAYGAAITAPYVTGSSEAVSDLANDYTHLVDLINDSTEQLGTTYQQSPTPSIFSGI